MQFKHAPQVMSVAFDDPNLVSAAGLVPVMRLAHTAGVAVLSQDRLTVRGDKGANAGAKAVARGEVDPAKLTPRVIAVPFDFCRQEVLMTPTAVSDDVAESIVDEVFLPLVAEG